MAELPPDEPQNVQMDAKADVTVKQDRVLTRDDELRLFSLNLASKDRISFDKQDPTVWANGILTCARLYYAFLTEGD